MNNDLFVHSWGDLPIIFTRDCITRDNYWWINPRVTKNSLFMATHTSLYFLYAFPALKYREIDVKSHRWVTAQCCLWWFSWMRYCDITKTSIVTSFWLIALRTFLSRSQMFLSGSQTFLSGSQTFLSGSQTFLSGSQTFLSGSQTSSHGHQVEYHLLIIKSDSQHFNWLACMKQIPSLTLNSQIYIEISGDIIISVVSQITSNFSVCLKVYLG